MEYEKFIEMFALFALVISLFSLVVILLSLPQILRPLSKILRPKLHFSFPPAPSTSVSELLLWANEFNISLEQLRETYNWQIGQWTTFGNAVLAATLAFASAVFIAVLKEEIVFREQSGALLAAAGILVSIALYVHTQRNVSRLRREFLALFNILSLLK